MPRENSTPTDRPGGLRADPVAMREYKRQWIASRRAAWFAEHGPCGRCGSWDDLELDHIDRRTKVHHAIWSWSQERRDAELLKCQVLCRPCHVQKGIEAGDIPPPAEHGTRGRYEKHGCRCEACRHWKRDKARRLKANKPRRVARIKQALRRWMKKQEAIIKARE